MEKTPPNYYMLAVCHIYLSYVDELPNRKDVWSVRMSSHWSDGPPENLIDGDFNTVGHSSYWFPNGKLYVYCT